MTDKCALSQINVYPAKSVAGVSLSSSWVEKQGLSFDRRFMIALKDGSMVTARKYPQMVLVTSTLHPSGVIFNYQDKTPLKVFYADLVKEETRAQVWSDEFGAYTTTAAANEWFIVFNGKAADEIYTRALSNGLPI